MADRTIFIQNRTVNEGIDTILPIFVQRTGDLTQSDTFSIDVIGGTATEFEDFTGGSGTLTFAPGASLININNLPLLDDDFAEGLETIQVQLTDPGGNAPGLTLQDGTITIFDDENSEPFADLDSPPSFSTEFGTPLTFSVANLLAPFSDPDGDPISFDGFDFDGTVSDIISAEIVDNGDGTFTYTPFFNPTIPGDFNPGGNLFYWVSDDRGGSSLGLLNLNADDPEFPNWNLEFGGMNVEGDTGTTTATFTLERVFPDGSGASDQLIDYVRVQTGTDLLVAPDQGEGVATSGVDFVPFDEVLTFGANANSIDIVVQINGDIDVELNELFDLDLYFTTGPNGEESFSSFGVGDALLPQDATATIVNDDVADFVLELGTPETGKFGNNFEGATAPDGIVRATFDGTGTDLALSFQGFDVDFDDEIEVFLNGTSLGLLAIGVNEGFAGYNFVIPAASQQDGLNTITFSQELNNNYKWGVTDVLLIDPNARTISAQDITLDETSGDIVATFTRTGDLSRQESFNFDFVGGPEGSGLATEGVDFSSSSSSSFFFADEASFQITIGTILDDDFAEGLETLDIVFSALPDSAPGLTFENATITIRDDENSDPDFFEGPSLTTEFATPVNFTLDQLLDGTTDPDGDPVSFGGFFDGVGGSVNVNDVTDNGDGTFTYSPGFFDPGGVLFYEIVDGRGGVNVGGISFDVEGPTIPIYNLEFGGMVIEGDSGTTTATFTLERFFADGSGASDQLPDFVQVYSGTDLLVAPEDGEGIATSGVDFVPFDQVFAFGPDGNSFDIVVQIIGDTEVEPNEIFDLELFFTTGPNGEESTFSFANVALPQDAIATILNDDIVVPVADIDLTIGVEETGNFGNRFAGTSDLSGDIDASFTSAGTDLTLTFDAFDIDFDNEVSVLLNGVRLGLLATGFNEGFSSYSFDIAAEDQLAGFNTITFQQELNNNYVWGVTDILLAEDPANLRTVTVEDATVLESSGGNIILDFTRTGDVSQQETFLFQSNFGTATADDFSAFTGQVTFTAGETTRALTLSGNLLNDNVAEGTESFTVSIINDGSHGPGLTTVDGTITIIDDDTADPQTDINLAIGTAETGNFGNRFAGTSDLSGDIDASFTSAGTDLTLTFDAFDIDFDNEVSVLLNGVRLGLLATGFNEGFSSYSFDIAAEDQLAGFNTITFQQELNNNYVWGVTDILLVEAGTEPPVGTTGSVLVLDVENTASFGNRFDGQTDADGVIDFTFDGGNGDLNFDFQGFDIDIATEVELFLNGTSQGFLGTGVNEGFEDYSFALAASDQVAGENVLTFEQAINDTFIWGVTDLLISEAGNEPPTGSTGNELLLDVENTGSFGNRFDGQTDADGVIDFTFDGTNDDLVFNFQGYDIDVASEVELFLNGSSQGFLGTGVDNGLEDYSFVLAASDQVAGENVLTFEQQLGDTLIWGVTDLLITA